MWHLVPGSGTEPMPSALEAWSLSVWSIRKSQELSVFSPHGSPLGNVSPKREAERERERERMQDGSLSPLQPNFRCDMPSHCCMLWYRPTSMQEGPHESLDARVNSSWWDRLEADYHIWHLAAFKDLACAYFSCFLSHSINLPHHR